MKQKIFVMMITTVMFLIWLPWTHAELYKYVDENGVVSYTDDYSEVPKSDRDAMDVIEEFESTEEDGSATGKDALSKKEVNEKDIKGKEVDSTKNLDAMRDKLNNTKKELDKEYNALNIQKAKLAQEEKQAKSKEELLKYNENVNSFNKSLEAYSEKSKNYQKQAKEFNKQVKEFNNKIKSKN